MNLVTIITATVAALALIELLLTGMPGLKRSLFHIAMAVVVIGFTSKYYYGPDITTYVPLYERTGTLLETLSGQSPGDYETGFICFSAICKSLGLSFWGMTAAVSLIFFGAVYLLLSRLDDKRVLALALLTVLLPDLICLQLRQCLAVSFFIYAIITADTLTTAKDNRMLRTLTAIMLAIIAMTMHKSAVFIVVPVFVYYLLQPLKPNISLWGVLLTLLIIMAIVPTEQLIGRLIDSITADSPTAESLKLHLSFAKLHQTNFIIYLTAIVLLAMYARRGERREAIAATAAAGLILITVLYQYYFLLGRLRSYFMPVLVYVIFRTMGRARELKLPYINLVRQVAEIMAIVFIGYKVWSYDQNSARDGNVMQASTIFELADNKPEELRQRQLDRAEQFWHNSFLKSDMQNTNRSHVLPAKKQ